MKPHLKKILAALGAVAVLAFAFWYGGNAPGLRGWDVGPSPTPFAVIAATSPAQVVEAEPSPLPTALPTATPTATPTETVPPVPTTTPTPAPQVSPTAGGEMVLDPQTGKDQYLTDPVPQGKPLPMEPQDVVIGDTAYTCTLSVRCDTILAHMDWLDVEKKELVPENGVIFPATEVTFYEGESVFDLLLREMKNNKIHMEFVNTPIYNSAYIEGIHNLYEFDCGELSGWMYKVNGWFPNYGCSRYALQPGDSVEWVYTCDLGADVGGSDAAGGQT